ncbi:hypothetical protein [Pseudomonas sp. W5-36]|uniref:hypothetical protein n=1 Tax=Pseudomonas sp. W5-36 TaxID=3097455 RepID=UPI00397B1958
MQSQSPDAAPLAPHPGHQPDEPETELDADMDPGNEDPGSQFDRDATVPLIDPDK